MMKNFFNQFGGKVTITEISKLEKSKQWVKNKFMNIEPTTVGGNILDLPRIIYKQFSNQSARSPKSPIPIVPFNITDWDSDPINSKAKFIWYGHSAIMSKISGKTILIDPMLGQDTTPIAPFSNKRFSEGSLEMIDQFPTIDLLLISHDHYDHLDFDSIEKLKSKTKKYWVALGVKKHLVHWGINPDLIFEFDWWDSKKEDNITITFTPTRHFSGRGITDRAKCLWGGWAIKNENENIWFSGDSGYGEHFKTVGEKLGPFDFAFMECGQYNHDWHMIHMFPEESVKAALDAKVKKGMPVHWAGFDLSYQHSWKEPADDFVKFAKENAFDYSLPKIGEVFEISDVKTESWWDQYQ